jgi:hypothetical protein
MQILVIDLCMSVSDKAYKRDHCIQKYITISTCGFSVHMPLPNGPWGRVLNLMFIDIFVGHELFCPPFPPTPPPRHQLIISMALRTGVTFIMLLKSHVTNTIRHLKFGKKDLRFRTHQRSKFSATTMYRWPQSLPSNIPGVLIQSFFCKKSTSIYFVLLLFLKLKAVENCVLNLAPTNCFPYSFPFHSLFTDCQHFFVHEKLKHISRAVLHFFVHESGNIS